MLELFILQYRKQVKYRKMRLKICMCCACAIFETASRNGDPASARSYTFLFGIPIYLADPMLLFSRS